MNFRQAGLVSDALASQQPERGFVGGGDEVGRAKVGDPQFYGAIPVFKHLESGILVLSEDARDLVSGDPANLPVGGQTKQNGHGDHSARGQCGKGFVHAAFVPCGSNGARLGLLLSAFHPWSVVSGPVVSHSPPSRLRSKVTAPATTMKKQKAGINKWNAQLPSDHNTARMPRLKSRPSMFVL